MTAALMSALTEPSRSTKTELPPLLSLAEFLDWPGDGTDTRYELIDGVLRAMAPASDAHNTILSNLVFLLEGHLRRNHPRCRVVATPGIQPHLNADWNFRIPDLGITCAPGKPGQVMMPEPVVLVEVLSPGNKQHTRENMRAYATIPSVRELILLESSRIRAEHLVRDEQNNWPANPLVLRDGDTLTLQKFNASWPLREFYHNTWLLSPPPELTGS